MKYKLLQFLLVIIGLITSMPVLAIIDPQRMFLLSYGINVSDPMVQVLLQHRGVFQLMLGIFIILSAFYRSVRLPIALVAITTKGFFTVMVLSNEAIRPLWPLWVAIFDSASIIVFLFLSIYELRSRKKK